MNRIIKMSLREMDEKMKAFNRTQWDEVKMLDGVGIVSAAEKAKNKKRRSNAKRNSKRESVKGKKKKVRIASKDDDKESEKKDLSKVDEDADAIEAVDVFEVVDDSKDDEKANPSETQRASMKTPKASSQEKTWSHAMEDFKSVNKRKKKKMSKEDKQKLRQNRNNPKAVAEKEKINNGKRSSVKNPTSNLVPNVLNNGQEDGISQEEGIKMMQAQMEAENERFSALLKDTMEFLQANPTD